VADGVVWLGWLFITTGGHGFGIGFIGGDVDGGCYVTRPVMTPFGLSLPHRQRLRLLIQRSC